MMLGVEIVKDRANHEPAPELTADILERAKDLGLLLGKGGIDGNVFRIKPPMCWTREDVDFCCAVLDRCMSEIG